MGCPFHRNWSEHPEASGSTREVEPKGSNPTLELPELMRLIANAARDAIAVMDHRGQIVFWNHAAEQMFGFPAERVIGKAAHDILTPPEQREVAKRGVEEFALYGTGPAVGPAVEVEALCSNGERKPVELSIAPVRVEDHWWAIGVIRDITERKQAETEQRRQERELAEIINSLQAGVVVIDAETRQVLSANPAACSMLGYSQTDLVGQVCHNSICPREWGNCPVLDHGEPVVNDQREAVRADGQRVPILKSARLTTMNGRRVLVESFINISERIEAETLIRQSERKYRALFETSHDAQFTMSPATLQFTSANPAAAAMFGFDDESQIIGLTPLEVSPPTQSDGTPTAEKAQQMMRACVEEGQSYFEWTHARRDGTPFHASVMLTELQVDGETIVQAAVRDVTATREAHERLKQSEQRFALAVKGSQDGIWDWDLTTNKVYYSPRWKRMLGCRDDQVGDTPEEWFSRIASSHLPRFSDGLNRHILSGEEEFEAEVEMLHEDGRPRWMLCRAIAVRDVKGNAIRLAGALTDFTTTRQAEERLRHIARHDRLTDLPNRELLQEKLERLLKRDRTEGRGFAVMFFDFDRFKVINEGLGHDAGDDLLMSIANRFRSDRQDGEMACRFGGDEFVVVLECDSDDERMLDRARQMRDLFDLPHEIRGHEVVCTASVGVVIDRGQYDTPHQIFRDADAAMYAAKLDGRARLRLFDASLRQQAMDRMSLEEDMRRADFDEEFFLVYQPLVDLRTGEVTGVETLIRWNHPQRGMVPPDKFIPIAEDSGLIQELGTWVLRKACRQLAAWRDSGAAEKWDTFCVNISRHQLGNPSFPRIVRHAIDEADIPAECLVLEITENLLMDERIDMARVLEPLREIGVRIAVDDFGRGYSSLSSLHHFPIDILKLDRDFLINMESHRKFSTIVHSMIDLAQGLRLTVITEGIETPGQLAQLQAMDCDIAQGYFFSKPRTVEQIEACFATGRSLINIVGLDAADSATVHA